MPTIVAQYTDGKVAITRTLAQVKMYIKSDFKDMVNTKHAPHIVSTGTRFLAVFDIDDTLLFDMSHITLVRNENIIKLMVALQKLDIDIHLVTARLDCKDMRTTTANDLEKMNIKYTSLTLAPESARTSMSGISHWKMNTRKAIAVQHGSPIILTVGDQWGDMIALGKDQDINNLNIMFGAQKAPYILLRPEDGVSLWGLKLPSYS